MKMSGSMGVEPKQRNMLNTFWLYPKLREKQVSLFAKVIWVLKINIVKRKKFGMENKSPIPDFFVSTILRNKKWHLLEK